MESTIIQLTAEYSKATDSLSQETRRDVVQLNKNLKNLQQDREAKAIQLAEFIRQNLDELTCQLGAGAPDCWQRINDR